MSKRVCAFLLGLVLVTIPAIVSAQPCRLMGGAYTDKAASIVRSIDPANGYVMAGMTKSFGAGTPNFANALIVRADSFGRPINSVITTGTKDEEATSMIKTSDNYHVVTGWTRSYNAATTNSDIFVLKLRRDLSTVWAKVYHLTTNDYDHQAFSIIEASAALGGGYALTGWYSPNGTNREIFVMRLDVNGNVLWANSYKGPNNLYDQGFGITEVNDPTAVDVKFAVVGRAAASSTSTGDAFCLRLKGDGNYFSNEIMPGANDEAARSAIWDPSGATPGLVIAGWTKSYGNGTTTYSNVFVSKLRSAGTVIWSNAYYWPAGTTERDEQVLGDKALIIPSSGLGGGYALCGWTKSRGPSTPDYSNFLVIKLDYNGGIGWGGLATVHPSVTSYNYSDEAWSMVETKYIPTLPTPGQGYAIAGWTTSFNPGAALTRENFHFVTLNSSGQRPAGCALQFAMQKSSFAWTAFTFQKITRTVSTQNITLSTCTPSHLAVCYGTFSGFEPESNNVEGATEFSTVNSGLRIVPNPVRGISNVHYTLPKAGNVRLTLYDIAGKSVGSIAGGRFAAGNYTTRLDASRLLNGVYLLKFEAEGYNTTEKLIVE